MRILILLMMAFMIGCASNQQKKNESNTEKNICFEYPMIIDSLQVKDLFDSARWYVYTWHCDQEYLPKRDTSQKITFGELPLKFRNLNFKNDTLEINFDFIDQLENYPIQPSMTRDNKEVSTGVGFDLKKRAKIYMLSTNGYSSTIKGGDNRYENPLQADVVTYLRNHWGTINTCFRELAKKKGVRN